MQNDRFDDLRGFYERLDAHLQAEQAERPGTRGNACGTCFECCKYYFYLSRHEFEAIEAYLEQDGRAGEIRWVNCSTNVQDARRSRPVDPAYRCPLYREGVGCTVYAVRPLACRTLGPLLPSHSRLPSWCVYEHPRVYASTDEIPLWREFLELIHRHGGASRGYFEARPDAT